MDVSHKLGTALQECPQWLIAAPRDQIPQPERLAFTPPPRGAGMSPPHTQHSHTLCNLFDPLCDDADGQFIMPRPLPPPDRKEDVDESPQNQNRNIWGINNNVASKKRAYEHTNGVDGEWILCKCDPHHV